jgi:hypothetical protein
MLCHASCRLHVAAACPSNPLIVHLHYCKKQEVARALCGSGVQMQRSLKQLACRIGHDLNQQAHTKQTKPTWRRTRSFCCL